MAQSKRRSLIGEFLLFVKVNKAYWLVPILVVVLLLTLVIVYGGGAAAPFIYTLF